MTLEEHINFLAELSYLLDQMESLINDYAGKDEERQTEIPPKYNPNHRTKVPF